MKGHDERTRDGIPSWVWPALELSAPLSADDPDNVEHLLGIEPTVDLARIVRRFDQWDAEVLTLPLGARASYWTRKADALAVLHGADWLTWDALGEDPLDVWETLRARASAATHTAALVEVSANTEPAGPWPAWVRLAEPSRGNDKWGPLIPLLDYAEATTLDSSNDGILRRWAEICRQHDEARAHCEAWGLDTALMMPVPTSRIIEFKNRAKEHRRSRRGNP